ADTEYAAEGYRVIVLRAFGYRTNISLRRYASHWRFARRLAAEMPGRPAPDVIVTSLPPLDTAAATADYATHRRIPLVADVIDPWPDGCVELLPPALQRAGRVVSSPLRRRATRIVRSAHAVTAISRRYAAWAEGLAAPQPLSTAVFHPAVQLAT